MSAHLDPALRAWVGVAVRSGDAEAERIARQNLAEAKLARDITNALNADHSLSREACDRLASLLQNGGK